MPKELTPARRGPALSQGVSRELTRNGPFAKSIRGFGASKWRLGGSSRCSSACTVLIRPAMPAAVSRCPTLVFTEPRAQKPGRGEHAAKASVKAATSIGSPIGVPVPCAST